MYSLLRLPLPPLPPKSLKHHHPLTSIPTSLHLVRTWPRPVAPANTSRFRSTRFPVPLAFAAASGDSGGHGMVSSNWIAAARRMFDKLPQPVKDFPWSRLLRSFQDVVFGLALVVVKYLSIPVLAVSSLSEMSYCAHERRIWVVPIPFLAGFTLAGIFSRAAIDISPDLEKQENPWHLILIAAFFLLVKLPGPYYPYLGRLCIPHFANGGLWRTAWLLFMWHRRHKEAGSESAGSP